MLFSKEHLLKSYDWTAQPGGTIYTDAPSRRMFDRFNGNQMLFMINLHLNPSGTNPVDDGRRIEALIMNELPTDIKSEISVYNWLKNVLNTPAKTGIVE